MKMFAPNLADCYKVGHPAQYNKDMEFLYSNLTPRSARLFRGSSLFDNKMVVFGVLGFIKEILIESWNETFFKKSKEEVVRKYKRRMDSIFGQGIINTDKIEKLHDLGYLPISVKAIPEGSRVDINVPVITIENTVAGFGWVVNYLETVMSAYLWKMCTNATIAYEYRRVFEEWAAVTGGDTNMIQFQGHDFSFRGMSGPEDAARCGAAHLLSFTGTDAIPAIDYLEDYYNADCEKELIGCSVPATEHSVATTNIMFIMDQLVNAGEYKGTARYKFGFDDRLLAEYCFLKEYITEKYPTGIVSYVADSYDFWGVVTKILPALKEEIMARDGKLVVRPDSGDPVKICAGYILGEVEIDHSTGKVYSIETDKELPEYEAKGAVQVLWEIFGGTTNEEGFIELDSHIGLIYGDSITLNRQDDILSRLHDRGFASTSVVFGIGSYTYQYSTRDSLGTAMKATACVINGELIEVYKDPATGDGNKKSARGLLRVELDNGGNYVLHDRQSIEEAQKGELKEVFRDGAVLIETSLAEIRKNLLS